MYLFFFAAMARDIKLPSTPCFGTTCIPYKATAQDGPANRVSAGCSMTPDRRSEVNSRHSLRQPAQNFVRHAFAQTRQFYRVHAFTAAFVSVFADALPD